MFLNFFSPLKNFKFFFSGEGNGGISRFFGTLRRTSVAFITCAYEESEGSGFFGGMNPSIQNVFSECRMCSLSVKCVL